MMGQQVDEEDKDIQRSRKSKDGGMQAWCVVGSQVESNWVWLVYRYQLVLRVVAGDDQRKGALMLNEGV